MFWQTGNVEVYSGDPKEDIPVEARSCKNIPPVFFSLDPDEKVIAAYISKRFIWRMLLPEVKANSNRVQTVVSSGTDCMYARYHAASKLMW